MRKILGHAHCQSDATRGSELKAPSPLGPTLASRVMCDEAPDVTCHWFPGPGPHPSSGADLDRARVQRTPGRTTLSRVTLDVTGWAGSWAALLQIAGAGPGLWVGTHIMGLPCTRLQPAGCQGLDAALGRVRGDTTIIRLTWPDLC